MQSGGESSRRTQPAAAPEAATGDATNDAATTSDEGIREAQWAQIRSDLQQDGFKPMLLALSADALARERHAPGDPSGRRDTDADSSLELLH